MKAYDPNMNAADGSVGEAAAYLIVSIVSLLGSIVAEFNEITVLPLFLVWLSASLFTLGIIEYRRSQHKPKEDPGPEP